MTRNREILLRPASSTDCRFDFDSSLRVFSTDRPTTFQARLPDDESATQRWSVENETFRGFLVLTSDAFSLASQKTKIIRKETFRPLSFDETRGLLCPRRNIWKWFMKLQRKLTNWFRSSSALMIGDGRRSSSCLWELSGTAWLEATWVHQFGTSKMFTAPLHNINHNIGSLTQYVLCTMKARFNDPRNGFWLMATFGGAWSGFSITIRDVINQGSASLTLNGRKISNSTFRWPN